MNLRHEQPHEREAVRSLLAGAELPVADLDDAHVRFVVAVDNDALVGAVGLESFGDAGLLRSLVVRPALRGTGIGGRLVESLESLARKSGCRQLVLLTQTAAPFFASRGYRVIERNSAPDSVRSAEEFRSLCPASATCMTKILD